jgi:alcohol dehydrogenase
VVATGPAVKRLKVGDPVLGFAADGCYAQYAINTERRFWSKPDGLSFEFASILPSTGVTVFQAFHCVPDLPEQIQRGAVLIQGGSGGTGSLAVLLAKHYFQAPLVFATCSSGNMDYVSKLGADRVIDYNHQDFEQVIRQEYGKPLQFVLDCAGGSYETWRKAKRLLGPRGVFASIAYPFDEQKMTAWDFIGLVLSISINKAHHLFGGPHFFWHLGEAREDEIEILASFFNQHPALRDLILIHHFPLTMLADAYQHVERHQGGKVVIDIS